MSGIDGRGNSIGAGEIGAGMLPHAATPAAEGEAAAAAEVTRSGRPRSLDMRGLSLAGDLEARLAARTSSTPAKECWIGASAKLGGAAIEAKNDKRYAGGRLAGKTDLQITRLVPASDADAQAIRDRFAKQERDGSDSLLLREPATGAFFIVAADEIKNIKTFEPGQARKFSFVAPDGKVRETDVVVEARENDRDGFLNDLGKALGSKRPDEKVYRVLGQQEFDAATSFTPSVGAEVDKSKFKKHEKTYDIPFDFETVWSAYTGARPDEAWPSGSTAAFNRTYSRADNRWTEKGDASQKPIQPGSIYFIDLEIAKVMNIPAGFEITKISKEDKVIEFTYLEQNVSHGRQTMQFVEKDGRTELVHTSYFTSGKEWRDKLYPKIHEKLVDGFHANMQRLMEKP